MKDLAEGVMVGFILKTVMNDVFSGLDLFTAAAVKVFIRDKMLVVLTYVAMCHSALYYPSKHLLSFFQVAEMGHGFEEW